LFLGKNFCDRRIQQNVSVPTGKTAAPALLLIIFLWLPGSRPLIVLRFIVTE